MSITSSLVTSLRQDYHHVRQQTLSLAAPLRPEDSVVQPVVDVSPPKWHLGHTTWFFEQFFLSVYVPDYQVFHPRFAYLFNSYYEGAGERIQRSWRGNMTRPTLDEIRTYRAYVDTHMDQWLATEPILTPRQQQLMALGLQHEQQHQELMLYDIKYILGHNPLFPAYDESAVLLPAGTDTEGVNWLEMEAGIYEIGFRGDGFHFDNEEGRHRVFLEAYQVQDRLVTCGEFAAFVAAGGYQNYRYWLEEGWKWVNTHRIDTPFYWFRQDGQWYQFTHHGLQPLDLSAPMSHVNYYEADAYARWRGLRLPTEFEWEAACQHHSPAVPATANFTDTGYYRPAPRQAGDYQFYGDVWEWTSSAYLPYPYFTAEDSAIGEYNGKFMVNQMVLRGGSCATPRDHIRPTYRNFFHPHLQWLFSGIRLAAHL
ncbi:MAG: ergothioneine biosynthesis protein EgtB [Bacteroidia bacterium]|nr:ergothioneine biosynthesis protein EgtB [Bacteroidia bacterium]